MYVYVQTHPPLYLYPVCLYVHSVSISSLPLSSVCLYFQSHLSGLSEPHQLSYDLEKEPRDPISPPCCVLVRRSRSSKHCPADARNSS